MEIIKLKNFKEEDFFEEFNGAGNIPVELVRLEMIEKEKNERKK